MKFVVKIIIKAYQKIFQYIFPLKICRHYPTCSDYTYQAVETFGVGKGLYLGAKRILKCNPLFSEGYDPVVKSR